jgi:HEPN domain-containing protein
VAKFAMDKTKRTAIEHWFIKAENEIRAEKASLNADPPITEDVCFHSQQAIEKLLKAFLVYMDKEFPKTHDLTNLVGLCGKCDIGFLELIPIVEGMTA